MKYCSVMLLASIIQALFFALASGAEIGCRRIESGLGYNGQQNVTKAGHTCLKWATLTVKHDYLDPANSKSFFPEKKLVDAVNYCRNPENGTGLWCYIADALGSYEYCDVPLCPKDQFKTVFKGLAGIGKELLSTWNDDSSTKPDETCVTTGKCHYKHNVVNHWQASNITQVRVILYKDDKEKVILTFTNRPTDNRTSWFSPCNLLTTFPWTDLNGYPTNYFSPDGYSFSGVSPLQRHFYICRSWVSCVDDMGWMVINDYNRNLAACGWESKAIPTILYSSSSTAVQYNQMEEADSVVISVITPLEL